MKPTAVALKRKEEALASGGLRFSDALESPCLTCESTPCCNHLPLPAFPMENLMQVDHARWLLGFAGMELGVTAAGEWSAFYVRACRFLNGEDGSCTIHGTPEQPRICVHYNPYTCWYRKALVPTTSADFLRIDRRRFQALLPHLRFDDHRNLIGVPTWEALQDLFATMPVERAEPLALEADAVMAEWRQIALGRQEDREPEWRTAGERLETDPCTDCSAHCCTNLQFSIEAPSSVTSIDYLRFALGFPGVQVGVGDDGWSFIVRTRCRHLIGTRCGLYGSSERPLRCQYYDAAHCPYPTLLGRPRPAGFVRIELEQLSMLEASMSFADDGTLLALPTAEELRTLVEERWVAQTADSLLPA